MSNYIMLMKNKRVVINKSWKEFYKEIAYLLIPIDEQLNIFILQKPNRFLLNFDRALLSYEMASTKYDLTSDPPVFDSKAITKTKLEITNMVELLRSLYSLNKISFGNTILQCNDSPIYTNIQFCYFSLKLYKGDKLIKKVRLSSDVEKVMFESTHILHDLRDVYWPYSCGRMENKYLLIDGVKNRWEYSNKVSKKGLCGINLLETEAYSFYQIDDIKSVSRVSSLYSQIAVYDKYEISSKEVKKLIRNIGFDTAFIEEEFITLSDYWVCSLEGILEYIIFLPYLFMLIQTIIEVNETGECQGEYTVDTYNEVIFDGNRLQNHYFESSTNSPISIKDFINICKGGN